MVSPDILGASAGAGFGAALALLLSFHSAGVHILAFAFGIVAVGLTYVISKAIGSGGDEVLLLVLVGMVISALFQAFISAIKYVADPNDKLPAITFWLMGGLSSIAPMIYRSGVSDCYWRRYPCSAQVDAECSQLWEEEAQTR
jgi:iron complex transport system permease protein